MTKLKSEDGLWSLLDHSSYVTLLPIRYNREYFGGIAILFPFSLTFLRRWKSQRSKIPWLAYRFSIDISLPRSSLCFSSQSPRFLFSNHKHLRKVLDFWFGFGFLLQCCGSAVSFWPLDPEFLNINLTTDWSLLLHAIHSLLCWRILQKKHTLLWF